VRLARRRGRKRKAGARFPGGKMRPRPTGERVEDIVAVARDARRRVFGLSTTDALRPEAGEVAGRLCLSGEITRAQYEAALAYEAMRRNYNRALGARRVVSSSQILDPLGGAAPAMRDEAVDEARVRKAIDVHDRVRAALNACSEPLAQMVLDAVVLEGRTMWSHIGTLRVGLNAVGRVLKLPGSVGDTNE